MSNRFPPAMKFNGDESDAAAVYLIGAGPGDPGLLTLRGAELLSRADVVLYDGLVNVELLRMAAGSVQICVGKHGSSRIWRQSEIIAETLRHVASGKRVARLKGGDPAVFARTSEEVSALRSAGVRFEIVPGITAALAAGSYAGIPVTDRGLASAVALVTGHEEPGKPESALDWKALAAFPGTLVVYMGVTTARTWVDALVRAGKPPETPTAIIRRCSLGDQQALHCRLDEVGEILGSGSSIRPPVISIIGPVTELAEQMDWFSRRPLFGQTVVVTRPIRQAEGMSRLLRDQGASVLCQPLVEVSGLLHPGDLDRAIDRFSVYDVIVFCSRSGVEAVCERMSERGLDGRAFGSARLAAVGRKTSARMNDFFLAPDIVPETFTGSAVAARIVQSGSFKSVLVVRASRGGESLRRMLTEAGIMVDEVIAYRNTDVAELSEETERALAGGKVDWITVTSSATARNLGRLLGERLKNVKLASLSPVTSKVLREIGFPPAAEATEATVESLVRAIRASQAEAPGVSFE